jgi:hypothetical protein
VGGEPHPNIPLPILQFIDEVKFEEETNNSFYNLLMR